MASIVIRNLDDSVKSRLRIRAAEHGRSMDEEARHILRAAVEGKAATGSLVASIRVKFGPLDGAELEVADRELMPPPIAVDGQT